MSTPSSDLRQSRPHNPALTLFNYVIVKAQVQPDMRVEYREDKLVMEEPGSA